MTTFATVLQAARQRIPVAEARMLLVEAAQCSPAWLVAHDTDEVPAEVAARYADWVCRREQGEPVAYIIGWREFYGHRFHVAPGVLIPRPETELLVEQGLTAVEHIKQPRILDLGTGSGCIAISIALARPDAIVVAVDRSAVALAIAQGNARKLKAVVQFIQADWAAPLAKGLDEGKNGFDLIVSNPPYIAPGDVHLSQGDLRFEPSSALAAEEAGLADLVHIVSTARTLLAEQGCLLCEHGYEQSEAMRALLVSKGYAPVQFVDLAGIVRVSGGRVCA